MVWSGILMDSRREEPLVAVDNEANKGDTAVISMLKAGPKPEMIGGMTMMKRAIENKTDGGIPAH